MSFTTTPLLALGAALTAAAIDADLLLALGQFLVGVIAALLIVLIYGELRKHRRKRLH